MAARIEATGRTLLLLAIWLNQVESLESGKQLLNQWIQPCLRQIPTAVPMLPLGDRVTAGT
jgi:hypothetical protein